MKDSCPYKAIGLRVREARFLLGDKKQGEFGQQLGGFSTGQIGQVERGRNLPTGELLLALARQGINLNYILTGEGSIHARQLVRLSQRVSPEELQEILAELDARRGQVGDVAGVTVPPTLEMIREVDRRVKALEEARKKKGDRP